MLKQTIGVLLCLSTLGLGGCGFALRGTAPSTLAIASEHRQTQIILEDNQTAFTLKAPLTQKLNLLGIQTDSGNNVIKIDNLRFRRYELVGTLTEVRLVLMANVSYTLNGKTTTNPVQVEHSYQFNEASVSTLDQQGDKVRVWLYDALAERIAEQYRALGRP